MERRTFQDINTLIELFENSDWRELSIGVEDFSLHLSRDEGAAGPGQGSSPPTLERPRDTAAEARPSAEAPASATEPLDEEALEGLTVVRAPNLGLFYRSPEPGAPPYVQVGEAVGEDTEVCVIEVDEAVHAGGRWRRGRRAPHLRRRRRLGGVRSAAVLRRTPILIRTG